MYIVYTYYMYRVRERCVCDNKYRTHSVCHPIKWIRNLITPPSQYSLYIKCMCLSFGGLQLYLCPYRYSIIYTARMYICVCVCAGVGALYTFLYMQSTVSYQITGTFMAVDTFRNGFFAIFGHFRVGTARIAQSQ